MFNTLKYLSMHRSAWLILILSCTALEAAALYFQHGMGLAPCVMCIYERVALFGILSAGLLGFLAPKWGIFRWSALLLGLFSAGKGLQLAIKHNDYQINPAPWNQCSPFVEFPETLPLHQWFPAIFAPSGDCSKISWEFLHLSMPQWLIVVFSGYLAILGLVVLSQFTFSHTRKKRNLFR